MTQSIPSFEFDSDSSHRENETLSLEELPRLKTSTRAVASYEHGNATDASRIEDKPLKDQSLEAKLPTIVSPSPDKEDYHGTVLTHNLTAASSLDSAQRVLDTQDLSRADAGEHLSSALVECHY